MLNTCVDRTLGVQKPGLDFVAERYILWGGTLRIHFEQERLGVFVYPVFQNLIGQRFPLVGLVLIGAIGPVIAVMESQFDLQPMRLGPLGKGEDIGLVLNAGVHLF